MGLRKTIKPKTKEEKVKTVIKKKKKKIVVIEPDEEEEEEDEVEQVKLTAKRPVKKLPIIPEGKVSTETIASQGKGPICKAFKDKCKSTGIGESFVLRKLMDKYTKGEITI